MTEKITGMTCEINVNERKRKPSNDRGAKQVVTKERRERSEKEGNGGTRKEIICGRGGETAQGWKRDPWYGDYAQETTTSGRGLIQTASRDVNIST